MPRKRRSFSAAFKAKVALDAHKGLKTTAELAKQHQIHPTQVVLWKKQLLEGVEGVFEGTSLRSEKTDEPGNAELYEQIGKLNMQPEWLKKKWPSTVAEKRQWIDWNHPSLSIREQCQLLGLNRSNLYYEPLPESSENLKIMRMIDEEYMRHPAKGQRQMVSYLERQGITVNRKRVKRLMKNMGLEALAPKPRTTTPSKGNKVYPYLLRGLEIARSDHVWCSDITYVPVRRGYLYLCAVMDWHSRFVISWRLSNSMDTTFVI